MKQIKTGNAVACEYAALGAYGKHTLVNIYTGDIVVQELPARIPIAFYIEVIPDSGMPSSIKLEVFQNKKLRFAATAEFEFEADKIGLVVLPQLPFSLEKNTEVRLVASCEGYKATTLVRKRISVGPIPPG